jgi:hypothetical protein
MRYGLESDQTRKIAINRRQKYSQPQYRLCAGIDYPNLVMVRTYSLNELPPPHRQVVASDAQARQITFPHMCNVVFVEDNSSRSFSRWSTTSFRVTERHAE